MQVGPTSSVLQTGVQGIRTGQDQVNKAATEVVAKTATERPTEEANKPESSNLSQSLADLDQGKRQVQASAKVVEAGSETLGTMIDIRA